MPVKRVEIPKPGKPGEWRPLGIPAIYDRVCQQALRHRLEPIFEPLFDDSSFGYRPGRSAKDALRKVWREIDAGAEWIVDGDLKDYLDAASYCSPFHGSWSKRPGCESITLIRRPLRRPRQRWMA
jgi:retron-type reverse transcriptase